MKQVLPGFHKQTCQIYSCLRRLFGTCIMMRHSVHHVHYARSCWDATIAENVELKLNTLSRGREVGRYHEIAQFQKGYSRPNGLVF